MNWKSVKLGYDIGHIVHVREGCICIGSPYISEIIRITPDGVPQWVSGNARNNDDLARYMREMEADPARLRVLMATPDSFSASLPVYTYRGGEILEKQCEAYGYPNITHDGCLMYVNMFFSRKADAIRKAKANAQAGCDLVTRRIAECERDLAKWLKELAQEEADLAKLNHDYPEGGAA